MLSLVLSPVLLLALALPQDHPPRPLAPPLVIRPVADGCTIQFSFAGSGTRIALYLRPEGGESWKRGGETSTTAVDAREWQIRGLEPGKRYQYRLISRGETLGSGSFVTQRPPGMPFHFALISDTHVFVRDFSAEELSSDPISPAIVTRHGSLTKALRTFRNERAYSRAILPRVADLIAKDPPDFIANLGDHIDLYGFGFNVPVPAPRWAKKGFLDYRRLLGPLGANAAHFMIMGNWDGEQGAYTEKENQRARSQRLIYLPGPRPDTYLEGGSEHENYYAFTWGDALFVALDVVSYTTTAHMLDRTVDPGRPDDFTLGAVQMAWLAKTLAEAHSPWRFLLIHHAVGGNAGNARNSAYGRGGGRAAQVGEQAKVHALMRKYGVQIFFYGHDHVFTDMVVDEIHYTEPGSAGAPWKFGGELTGYEHYWTDSGYARVDVSKERIRVRFIDAEGELLHEYKIERR